MNSPAALHGKRVIIGLSGGVDSAVAALLLKQRGADVHALHMTNWEDDDGYCTAAADLQDARQVCEDLQIPLHHVNFSAAYRDRVFAYFLDEYRVGRTPNPDVLCNREIKFGVFREHAKRLGGDLLATGHYARIERSDGQVELHKAADGNKDQSYFLHAVSADALAETVFPLGEIVKSEVRELARCHGLKNYDKKDSTGICFIGERPFREFLSTYLPASPGPIRTKEGKTIGEHHGLIYYTLGQRQGLGVGGRQDSGDLPWYVAAKHLQENALIVVQGEDPLLYSDELVVVEPCWIGGEPIAIANGEVMPCTVKIRYRQPDQACTVTKLADKSLAVSFTEPQRAVAPGQYAVFYSEDRCLGGGVIDEAISRPSARIAAI
jgi:tRNA-specific 2-thiouridylase